LAIIFVLLNQTISASAEVFTKKIIASGRAIVLDGFEQQTEEKALESALYQAALQAGANIQGYSSYSSGLLMDEQTFVRTDTRIVDYAVISKNISEESVTVTIEAVAAVDMSSEMFSENRGWFSKLLRPVSKKSSKILSTHIDGDHFDDDSIFFFPYKRRPVEPSCQKLSPITLYLSQPVYEIGLNVPHWSLSMPKKVAESFYRDLDRDDSIYVKESQYVSTKSSQTFQNSMDYMNVAYNSQPMRPNEYYVGIEIIMDSQRTGDLLRKKQVIFDVVVNVTDPQNNKSIYKKSASLKLDRGVALGWKETDSLLKRKMADKSDTMNRVLSWIISDMVASLGCMSRTVPIQKYGSVYESNVGAEDGVKLGDLAVINNPSVRGGDVTPWIILVADKVEGTLTHWRLLDPKKESLVGQSSLVKLIN